MIDPVGKVGRFTQEDPAGLAGGLSAYGFATRDPVSYSDPFGLCSQADHWTNCPQWTATQSRAVFGQLAAMAPAINHEVAWFLPKNLLSALGGIGIGAAASRTLSVIGGGAATSTVVHFTSVEGAAAIEGSGALRAGSYVTTPSAVAGMSASEVESALEIQPGRGAMSFEFKIGVNDLQTPPGGTTTSGGAPQFQITRPVAAPPGSFVPTP